MHKGSDLLARQSRLRLGQDCADNAHVRSLLICSMRLYLQIGARASAFSALDPDFEGLPTPSHGPGYP